MRSMLFGLAVPVGWLFWTVGPAKATIESRAIPTTAISDLFICLASGDISLNRHSETLQYAEKLPCWQNERPTTERRATPPVYVRMLRALPCVACRSVLPVVKALCGTLLIRRKRGRTNASAATWLRVCSGL